MAAAGAGPHGLQQANRHQHHPGLAAAAPEPSWARAKPSWLHEGARGDGRAATPRGHWAPPPSYTATQPALRCRHAQRPLGSPSFLHSHAARPALPPRPEATGLPLLPTQPRSPPCAAATPRGHWAPPPSYTATQPALRCRHAQRPLGSPSFLHSHAARPALPPRPEATGLPLLPTQPRSPPCAAATPRGHWAPPPSYTATQPALRCRHAQRPLGSPSFLHSHAARPALPPRPEATGLPLLPTQPRSPPCAAATPRGHWAPPPSYTATQPALRCRHAQRPLGSPSFLHSHAARPALPPRPEATGLPLLPTQPRSPPCAAATPRGHWAPPPSYTATQPALRCRHAQRPLGSPSFLHSHAARPALPPRPEATGLPLLPTQPRSPPCAAATPRGHWAPPPSYTATQPALRCRHAQRPLGSPSFLHSHAARPALPPRPEATGLPLLPTQPRSPPCAAATPRGHWAPPPSYTATQPALRCRHAQRPLGSPSFLHSHAARPALPPRPEATGLPLLPTQPRSPPCAAATPRGHWAPPPSYTATQPALRCRHAQRPLGSPSFLHSHAARPALPPRPEATGRQ
nr:extensin-like [Pelodiscus sinensis]|eukprot:XP_025043010.1 extensin-like [Pelodiscus sinensis]